MRSTPVLFAIALAAAGALVAAPRAQAAPAASQAAAAAAPRSLDLPEGTLVASGPAADLEILFTGDVIGYIEPCG